MDSDVKKIIEKAYDLKQQVGKMNDGARMKTLKKYTEDLIKEKK